MSPDRSVSLSIDHSRPVTLARCSEILNSARMLSGRDLVEIDICHGVYSLTIFDCGEPFYANENGTITRSDDAAVSYYDSLDF